jgi:hypothetical protein
MVAKAGYELRQKKQINALKHLAELKLRKELRNRSPGGGSPGNSDGGRDRESRDTWKACDTAGVPQV